MTRNPAATNRKHAGNCVFRLGPRCAVHDGGSDVELSALRAGRGDRGLAPIGCHHGSIGRQWHVHHLVRSRRLELPRPFGHNDLNVARLPVPPRPHVMNCRRSPGGWQGCAPSKAGRGLQRLCAPPVSMVRPTCQPSLQSEGPLCPDWPAKVNSMILELDGTSSLAELKSTVPPGVTVRTWGVIVQPNTSRHRASRSSA